MKEIIKLKNARIYSDNKNRLKVQDFSREGRLKLRNPTREECKKILGIININSIRVRRWQRVLKLIKNKV